MKRVRDAAYLPYASVFFFYFMAVGLFTSMLSVYLTAIGLRPAEVSAVAGAAGLFTMAMQPGIGILSDALGSGRRVGIALLLASAGLGLAFSRFRSAHALFLLCGLTMGFLNSVNPYCERLASHSRFRYGLLRSWGGIGGALAPQISGIILDRMDVGVNFALFAVCALVTALCLWRIGDADGPDAGRKPARGNGRLFSGPYVLFLAVSFLFNGVTGAGRTFIPLLLRQATGSASLVGTILLGATLVELPVILFSNRFMDRFSGRTLLLADVGLTLLEYAVYSAGPGAFWICAAALLTKSLTTMLFIMITLKVVLDVVEEGRSLTALSLAATVSSLGNVAFTWTAGAVADALGLRAAFTALAAALAAALALSALIRPPQRVSGYFAGGR